MEPEMPSSLDAPSPSLDKNGQQEHQQQQQQQQQQPMSQQAPMEESSPPPMLRRVQSVGGARGSTVKSLPLGSVVKVFVTSVAQDYCSPWKRPSQRRGIGSGFCIKGRLILTNSHVIRNHTIVRVRKSGCATKYQAEVVCESQETDLALIKVPDDDFWEGMAMLELSSSLPRLDANCTVVGYPTGGDGLSVTRGVVSRICLNSYVQRCSDVTTIQIDAAINSGNSGGPVFSHDNKVVGMARAVIVKSQNIGYIISVPVIELFLQQYALHGTFQGVSSLGLRLQPLESPAYRRKLKLPLAFRGGVRVKHVAPTGCCKGVLQENDVLIAVDGRMIAADGSVELSRDRKDERVMFTYLISSKQLGSKCMLGIYRDGQKMEVSTVLGPHIGMHVVPILSGVDCSPKYLICGGLVFVPASSPWMRKTAKMKQTVPDKLFDACKEYKTDPNEELVLMSKVLASDCNFGYQHTRSEVLLKANGVEVKSFSHLNQIIKDCNDEFLEFVLQSDNVIVLSREECDAATPRILEQHAIAAVSMGLEQDS